jgi:L-amino acid N-acyltransferase
MLQGLTLRPATAADLPAINEIYNYYVANSTATYQTEPETPAAREAWFAAHGADHPVIVAMYGGKVAGWAALSRFRPRAAYRHTVEDALYVHNELLGMDIGSLMLERLVSLAGDIGHRSIVAIISADQPGSIHVHEKFGFEMAGRLKEAGKKFGKWLDTVEMQRML